MTDDSIFFLNLYDTLSYDEDYENEDCTNDDVYGDADADDDDNAKKNYLDNSYHHDVNDVFLQYRCRVADAGIKTLLSHLFGDKSFTLVALKMMMMTFVKAQMMMMTVNYIIVGPPLIASPYHEAWDWEYKHITQ